MAWRHWEGGAKSVLPIASTMPVNMMRGGLYYYVLLSNAVV